jgi:hypothetical protein
MRANANIFWILAVFLFLADGIYIFWSLMDADFLARNHNSVDWVGVVAIGLTGLLSAFIAFYLNISIKAQGGVLPEDRLDANIDDGEAEQGFFAPWSWWPVMLAGSGALIFLGLAVGVWVSFIGGAVVLISLVGWQYEFYRGYHAH